MPQYVDDKFDHLESDIDKIRLKHRMYISYSNADGARAVADEIINNALDECRNPRSPGNKIHIEFDERTGFITVADNGRGIPTNILEEIFTTLNSGSNLFTSNKAGLKAEVVGQNGVGSVCTCALAERVEITSYRGGTENIYKSLVFEEGKKISDNEGSCSKDKHGMTIVYKPSKIMGKDTHIIWHDIATELDNLQYLNKNAIKIDSIYYDKKGNPVETKYKVSPFENILDRNGDAEKLSSKYFINFHDDNVIEEFHGERVKRYLSMDIAFTYVNSLTPYIDSFSNSLNTVDNGDHLDGVMESLCRYLQTAAKNSMSDKEKEKLDIKWDDVKTNLSIAVALRTNYESLYTGQTKHKIVSPEFRRIIVPLAMDALNAYFTKNQGQLKDLIAVVKMNAKARREGDKVRQAVVKNTLTNWSSYKMKNFDPCTNKGKEYKELYIIEGDSAKGSLKLARDPRFQALFAIKGVSKNAVRSELDKLIGQNGNKEFTDLVAVLGCNVGSKFDINKLNYDKIIIASDADVDGLNIRGLLLAFFFTVLPEIIIAGKLFIAEPPLYRVDDKKDPFVINMVDYNSRYVKSVMKDYRIAYIKNDNDIDFKYLDKDTIIEFLNDSKHYEDDIATLSNHYRYKDRPSNERLIEMILEELTYSGFNAALPIKENMKKVNIQRMIDRISAEFPDIYYDDKDNSIKGLIDIQPQYIEFSEDFVRDGLEVLHVLNKWIPTNCGSILLKENKTGNEHKLSILGILKVLNKYKPHVEHRFKGLGENDAEDLRKTIMDPNTRMLIRVNISNLQNDSEVFQILRGDSKKDLFERKALIRDFKFDRDMIDT